jgi:hypothetical protein
MNRRKLLQGILQGSHQNISFPDLVNLQPLQGQTKAYEIREILRLIRRYNLKSEEEEA